MVDRCSDAEFPWIRPSETRHSEKREVATAKTHANQGRYYMVLLFLGVLVGIWVAHQIFAVPHPHPTRKTIERLEKLYIKF